LGDLPDLSGKNQAQKQDDIEDDFGFDDDEY